MKLSSSNALGPDCSSLFFFVYINRLLFNLLSLIFESSLVIIYIEMRIRYFSIKICVYLSS
jgi:hypothetical protein